MGDTTLRIILENVDFRLPTQVTDDNSVLALKSLVFQPLIRWKPRGRVEPGLFKSWETTNEGRSWRFLIQEQTYFHDGGLCDGDAVVSYIRGFLTSTDYFGMPWSYSRYFAETTITSDGPDQVSFVSTRPFWDLLEVLCDFWPCRLDSDGKPVLGTGPYRVVEFDRKNDIGHAILQHTGSPPDDFPRTIVATADRDGEKRLKALQNGEVDAALNLERADDLNLVDFQGPIKWGAVPSTLSVIYYLNCPDGIFSDAHVRRAANMAIDNEALVREVYHGLAVPAATAVSPHHVGFLEANLTTIPYDPEAASAIISKLGLSGKLLQLRTPVYMPEHAEKITAFVQKSLEAIGFRVQVELETNRPEYARSIGFRKNVQDLALFDSTPNTTFRVLDDKLSSSSHGTWWLGYHDDEFQALFGEARYATDPEKRADAYADCLQRLQRNPPWLYIAHPHVVWATSPDVHLRIGPSGVLTLGQEPHS